MAWTRDVNVAEESEKQSRINAAGLINSTLENLWNRCYTAMANGNYLLWNTHLDSIWAILGGDEKEGGDSDEKMNKINLLIYKYGNLNAKINKGFDSKINPNNSIQYHLLLRKSLFLRRLQNSQGKGTAYVNEDEDDID